MASDASPPPSHDRWQRRPWQWGAQLIAAITFYTRIPIPGHWPMSFEGIARYAPLVGLGIGGVLATSDLLLAWLGMPIVTRSGLLVAIWILLTGGLHLDGAMDTADGLAVPDKRRRLAVMADSRAGAFGVMVAVVLVGLKGVALIDLESLRWFGVMAAAGWGRWGQVIAIDRYPYLKAEGKGAFHKSHARPATDWMMGLVMLIGFCGIVLLFRPEAWLLALGTTLGGFAISILVGAWLNLQLGGHTGDTYGATVEWTEALLLCLMTGLLSSL
ncbi:MAG: adenosylcobinamide-GDP ribazoletransferase [Leptolyngbya sp. SIO1D8]|nr:adenosylcobinamide-GDP ribazoletransferase [Leptolyngbya sp. SIO1D8]